MTIKITATPGTVLIMSQALLLALQLSEHMQSSQASQELVAVIIPIFKRKKLSNPHGHTPRSGRIRGNDPEPSPQIP